MSVGKCAFVSGGRLNYGFPPPEKQQKSDKPLKGGGEVSRFRWEVNVSNRAHLWRLATTLAASGVDVSPFLSACHMTCGEGRLMGDRLGVAVGMSGNHYRVTCEQGGCGEANTVIEALVAWLKDVEAHHFVTSLLWR
jgi:hypothetical protein